MDIKVITWPDINWRFLGSLKDAAGLPFADTYKRMPCAKTDPLALAYAARTIIEGVSSDVIDAESEYLGLMYGTFLVTDFKMAVIDEFYANTNIHHVYNKHVLIFTIDMYQLIELCDAADVWKSCLKELCKNASFDKWIKRTWRIL